MRCAVTALSHASPSRIKLQQHSHFVKLFLSIIMQFYAQVMCRIQIIQCNCSKIMSCAPHHEEHKKSTKYLYTCVRMCVCLCCAWGPDGSHIGSSSCLFNWKKCGRGQKERLARRGGRKRGERSMAGGPTSGAGSYLCSSSRPPQPQSRQRRNRRCRF